MDCVIIDLRDLLFSAYVFLSPPPPIPLYVSQHKALLHAVSEGHRLVVTTNVHGNRMGTSRGKCLTLQSKCERGQFMGFLSVTSSTDLIADELRLITRNIRNNKGKEYNIYLDDTDNVLNFMDGGTSLEYKAVWRREIWLTETKMYFSWLP
jgi:hypothetical protein